MNLSDDNGHKLTPRTSVVISCGDRFSLAGITAGYKDLGREAHRKVLGEVMTRLK